MAAMALPDRSVTQPPIEIRSKSQGLAWALWVSVSIIGGVAGALAAWQLRALVVNAPVSLADAMRYLATVLDAGIAAGAQWFLLRRFRLDVYWWIPATVAADLLSVMIVIPSVAGLIVQRGEFTPISPASVILAGGAALAAAGLVIGAAQAAVLRTSAGNFAWAWVPATVVGRGLAGALTSAISAQLFGIPPLLTITVVAAIGALLAGASQAPVLLRLLR
jgi:hypothetical protein